MMVAALGAIYEIGRAVFGPSNSGRLAAAGISGLVVLGALTASFAWLESGGRLTAAHLLIAGAVGLLGGVAFEAVMLAAVGRFSWRPRRGVSKQRTWAVGRRRVRRSIAAGGKR